MTVITVVGGLGSDPELRFTPEGKAVANFSVADDDRRFNRETNEWETVGKTTWYSCSVWNGQAENVAESLAKGMMVVVTGKVRNREYEKRDGSKGYSLEIEVDHVGPSLKFATAKVTRAGRSGGNAAQAAPAAAAAGDPWGSPVPAGAPAGGDPWAADSDEPPF